MKLARENQWGYTRILGELKKHLDHICEEYRAHYLEERPHQSLDNEPLKRPKKRGRPKRNRGPVAGEFVSLSEVRCKQRLGGVLKSYSRKAA